SHLRACTRGNNSAAVDHHHGIGYWSRSCAIDQCAADNRERSASERAQPGRRHGQLLDGYFRGSLKEVWQRRFQAVTNHRERGLNVGSDPDYRDEAPFRIHPQGLPSPGEPGQTVTIEPHLLAVDRYHITPEMFDAHFTIWKDSEGTVESMTRPVADEHHLDCYRSITRYRKESCGKRHTSGLVTFANDCDLSLDVDAGICLNPGRHGPFDLEGHRREVSSQCQGRC